MNSRREESLVGGVQDMPIPSYLNPRDWQRELTRLGVTNDQWKVTEVNKKFLVCNRWVWNLLVWRPLSMQTNEATRTIQISSVYYYAVPFGVWGGGGVSHDYVCSSQCIKKLMIALNWIGATEPLEVLYMYMYHICCWSRLSCIMCIIHSICMVLLTLSPAFWCFTYLKVTTFVGISVDWPKTQNLVLPSY